MNETFTPDTDARVIAYLDAVRGALAGVEPARVEALLSDVRAHIAEAAADQRAEGGPLDIDAILVALGEPETIAASVERTTVVPAAARPPFLDTRGGAVLTVITLMIGGFVIPFLGWIAGLVMLWMSRGWRTRDKVIGTVVPPAALTIVGILGLGAFTLAPEVQECFDECVEAVTPLMPAAYDIVWAGVAVVLLLAPIAVAVWLLVSFRASVVERDLSREAA